MKVEFLQSSELSVLDATYFVASFNGLAPGSSVAWGQCAAKILYVLRPRTRSKGLLIALPMTWPI
jgi:hypothetical protein